MTLNANLTSFATRSGAESKALRTLINGNAADLAALTTTNKANLVSALNWLHSELQTVVESATGIDDGVTATTTTWSSSKIATDINAAVAALVNGAPETLNTLQELAAEINDNESAISAINTALGNRVRFDAAQILTGPQQAQARNNIGAASAADIGATDTDYVSTFEAALV